VLSLGNDLGFGKRLKLALKEAGITQLEAAKRLGVNKDTITNYVKGRVPRPQILEKLAALCNVSPAWLLFGEDRTPVKNGAQENSDFARRFADSLKEASLDPAGLAELAGVDQAVVESALAGRLPDAVTLCRLARALGTTVEWLVTGEGPGPPQPVKRAREPDAARVMAAVAALEKEELESYLKGEMSPERFIRRVAELSGLPPPAVESLIQSMGRVNRAKNKEEAATSDLPEETKKLLCYWSELTEEQRKDVLDLATGYYSQKVAPGKSGPSGKNATKEKTAASPDVRQAEGF
jgi:transcriptional regulator with XRE-family HTH domain